MYTGKPPAGSRPLKTLERVISKSGLGSRTQARKWIGARRVSVNDRVVEDPDAWIDLELDRVAFDGKPLEREERVYLLLHKPVGYLTTARDPQGRPTVHDLLPPDRGYLFNVGRLDLDTSGLLIMTNDADFAERLTNPEFHVPKRYRVRAATPLDDAQLELLARGVELKDGLTRPAQVNRIDDKAFEITITEGRNRQVRRMVEAVGSSVVELVRVAIGDVVIGSLDAGATRALTPEEVRKLYGKED